MYAIIVLEATQCRLVSCSRLKTLLGLVDHASYHGKQNKEFQKFCYVIWQQTRGDVAGFEILPRTSEPVDALELIPQRARTAMNLNCVPVSMSVHVYISVSWNSDVHTCTHKYACTYVHRFAQMCTCTCTHSQMQIADPRVHMHKRIDR